MKCEFMRWTVLFCLGTSIVGSVVHFLKGNFAAGIGFAVAAIYAIGWIIEMMDCDCERMETETWSGIARKYAEEKLPPYRRNCDRFNTGLPRRDADVAKRAYAKEGCLYQTLVQWLMSPSTEEMDFISGK